MRIHPGHGIRSHRLAPLSGQDVAAARGHGRATGDGIANAANSPAIDEDAGAAAACRARMGFGNVRAGMGSPRIALSVHATPVHTHIAARPAIGARRPAAMAGTWIARPHNAWHDGSFLCARGSSASPHACCQARRRGGGHQSVPLHFHCRNSGHAKVVHLLLELLFVGSLFHR